jgi:hypothetical protein
VTKYLPEGERMARPRRRAWGLDAMAQLPGEEGGPLRGKREVLASEFFRLMRRWWLAAPGSTSRRQAGRALTMARALPGGGLVAGPAARDPVEVGHWRSGACRAEGPGPRLVRAARRRLAGSWPGAAETARRHEEALEVLDIACASSTCSGSAGDQETSRRINARSSLSRACRRGRARRAGP